MKPTCISEKLMYNTVRISTSCGSGTGSFFNFKIDDKYIPVIITNKHVVNFNPQETTTFKVHTIDDNGNPDGNIDIQMRANWIFHENKDICFCYINPLMESIEKKYGKKLFYYTNEESMIPTQEKLEALTALEELVMVGYPIGLWDIRNNFPIFRKGHTACHPAIDFNEDGIGLIDMACFPGSSGSPIFIFNDGGYRDKKGNTFLGQSRLILLGYLFAGPTYNANGELIIEETPTQQNVTPSTKIMTNLGYYVKASEILKFKNEIKKLI